MTTREPIDVVDAIFSTRSMRYLMPDPIPGDVIWDLLDAAIRGPTGGNMQQWAWIVVTDRDKKRAIAEWYREAILRGYGGRLDETTGNARVLGRGGTVDGASTIGLDRDNLLSVIHLAEHFEEVPVLVYGVLPDRRRSAPDLDTAHMNGVLAAGPILGAVQNLMLTARSYGVGSVLNGGGAGDITRNCDGSWDCLRTPSSARAWPSVIRRMGASRCPSASRSRRRPIGRPGASNGNDDPKTARPSG